MYRYKRGLKIALQWLKQWIHTYHICRTAEWTTANKQWLLLFFNFLITHFLYPRECSSQNAEILMYNKKGLWALISITSVGVDTVQKTPGTKALNHFLSNMRAFLFLYFSAIWSCQMQHNIYRHWWLKVIYSVTIRKSTANELPQFWKAISHEADEGS